MKQLDRNQEREAIALIEEIAWGDMDLHIRSVEDALERAVEATAEEFPLWEAEGEARYIDEFSVREEDIAGMTAEWRLAYVARLVRTVALVYGVDTGDRGNDLPVLSDPQPPFLLAEPGSPAGLLRALNDLIALPLTEVEPDRLGSCSPPSAGEDEAAQGA